MLSNWETVLLSGVPLAGLTAPQLRYPALAFLLRQTLQLPRVQPHALAARTAINLNVLKRDLCQLLPALGTAHERGVLTALTLLSPQPFPSFCERLLLLAIKILFSWPFRRSSPASAIGSLPAMNSVHVPIIKAPVNKCPLSPWSDRCGCLPLKWTLSMQKNRQEVFPG